MLQHPVNEAERLSLFGTHKVVALASCGNFFHTLAGVVCQDPVHTSLDDLQALQVNGHIRDLTLRTGRGLVDHDLGVGQSHPLALGTGAKQVAPKTEEKTEE